MHAILEAIRASARDQVREIEARADSQVYEILASARLEAKEIHEEACGEAAAPAAKERARILHRARLEALLTVGNMREKLVDTALERTRGFLVGVRTDQSYPVVLHLLTEEALDEIKASLREAGTIHLEVDPRDKNLMETFIPDLDLDLTVGYELDCWGGLVAKGEDGRVVVINTLESRLQRATTYLRHDLAALFEVELEEYKELHRHERTAGYGRL